MNKEQRRAAALEAEELCWDETYAFEAWRDSLETVPTIKVWPPECNYFSLIPPMLLASYHVARSPGSPVPPLLLLCAPIPGARVMSFVKFSVRVGCSPWQG